MSKILDLLKKENEKNNTYIQDQLAEIYISPAEKKTLDNRKKSKPEKKASGRLLGPVLILGLICIASFILLFSNNKLNIAITIVKDESPGKPSTSIISPRKEVTHAVVASSKSEPTKEVNLSLNGLPLNNIEFGGSAQEESKITDQYLYLANSRKLIWANVKIDFAKPINILDNSFRFTAKGESGGENLAIILTDINNKTYQSINIAPHGLNKVWQDYTIRPNQAIGRIDLTSVSQIKLEFGQLTANNSPSSIIYVTDLKLIQNKEVK